MFLLCNAVPFARWHNIGKMEMYIQVVPPFHVGRMLTAMMRLLAVYGPLNINIQKSNSAPWCCRLSRFHRCSEASNRDKNKDYIL